MAICPHCGREVPDDAVVCPYCGSQLREDVVVCGNCGRIIPADAKVCPYCGASLADVAICPNCGREIPADAKSCPYCGYRFDRDMPVVNIEYAEKPEPAWHHVCKVRGVKEKKEKPKTLIESEIFASAPYHAIIAVVLSFLILIIGLWFVIDGWESLGDIKSVGEAKNFIDSVKFSYATILAVEFILLFVGIVFSIKYLTIQENEFVGAFIYLFIFLLYSASQWFAFLLGLIYAAQTQSSSTGSFTNAAYAIYLNLTYVILLIGIMATFVSAHMTKSQKA